MNEEMNQRLLRYLDTLEDIDEPQDAERASEECQDRESYKILREFVRTNGKFYEPPITDSGLRPTVSGQCFDLGMTHAVRYGGIYVEGFSLRPDAKLAFHHGWVVTPDGVVVDPAISVPGVSFFGVAFESGYVESRLRSMYKAGTGFPLLADPGYTERIFSGELKVLLR
jgi:hypothetical protein